MVKRRELKQKSIRGEVFNLKKRFQKNNEYGFTLIVVLMVLVVLSILGLSINAIASNSVKISTGERDDQSVFYIAEAGLTVEIAEIEETATEVYNSTENEAEFFNTLNARIIAASKSSSATFENTQEKETKARIDVEELNTGNPREYKIVSVGTIGSKARKVKAIISIEWSENNEIIDDLLFYSKIFSFHGTAVNAESGSIIMDGIETHSLNGGSSLNIKNMYFNGPVKMNGGSASFGSKNDPGRIYVNGDLDFWEGTRNVYGDVRVNGNFRLKDAIINGDVYVNGDLELGWTPQIKKNIYYTGKLIIPSNYNQSLLSKVIGVDSVDSFTIPMVDFDLKEDSWYINNGYVVKGNETGTIPQNSKMLVDNYKNNSWQSITGQVVIVSKGDIILRGGNGFTGALIAPNGKVEYSGDGVFNGVIISKNEIKLSAGGNTINYKSLNEIFGSDIPLVVNDVLGEGNNENGSAAKDVKLTIKSSIKEE